MRCLWQNITSSVQAGIFRNINNYAQVVKGDSFIGDGNDLNIILNNLDVIKSSISEKVTSLTLYAKNSFSVSSMQFSFSLLLTGTVTYFKDEFGKWNLHIEGVQSELGKTSYINQFYQYH